MTDELSGLILLVIALVIGMHVYNMYWNIYDAIRYKDKEYFRWRGFKDLVSWKNEL